MISRKCDFCKEEIKTERFLEITVRELLTDGSESQDCKNQAYGDYCSECIVYGRAMKDLVISINEQSSEKHKIPGQVAFITKL